MNKIDHKTIEEYQKILTTDPNSKIFAVLAESYRDIGMIDQAENILHRGITKHPDYAPGYIVLAKILMQKSDFKKAINFLNRAISLSSDNLLALQLLGESQLQLKNPKEALKAYKKVLFLSPNNPRSLQVIKSLEKLTSDEFEPEMFSMQPLAQTTSFDLNQNELKKDSSDQTASQKDAGLERNLSFIDALIVRQQTNLAQKHLLNLQIKYPGNEDIKSRLEMITPDVDFEPAESIRPLPAREKRVIHEKIYRLRKVLQALETHLYTSL